MDHALYDKRRYPIVAVRAGYAAWSRTYEQTVHDEMDVRLLDRLRTVDWARARMVLDLACGTGRIGLWRRRRCPGAALDGVETTPEMLALARSRNLYRHLDEHLPDHMAGLPTHFDRAPGEPITIQIYVHLLTEDVAAAHAAGWTLREMDEGLVDAEWLRKKPKWERDTGMPVSFALVWGAGASAR